MGKQVMLRCRITETKNKEILTYFFVAAIYTDSEHKYNAVNTKLQLGALALIYFIQILKITLIMSRFAYFTGFICLLA